MYLRPLSLLLLLAVQTVKLSRFVDDSLDAVIVEADPEVNRDARHLTLNSLLIPQLYLTPQVRLPIAPQVRVPASTQVRVPIVPQLRTPVSTDIHCELKPDSNTSKTGEYTPETGVCRSINECYPYFKLHRLTQYDSGLMGEYGMCSYMTPLGRQIFGVCCNKTEEMEEKNEEVVIDVDIRGIPFHQKHSNLDWFSHKMKWGAIRPAHGGALVDNRIVNGIEARPHEYPFMAALMNHNRQFCGGSLIDDLHILTAAHCVAHMSTTDVKNLRVRLGDHNIKTASEASHVEMKVRRVVRHKGFSSKTLHNDVAILTLEHPVSQSHNIKPIELAAGSNNFVNYDVTVAGWGTLREGGIQPGVLMKVDVKVWPNQKCKNSYGHNAPGGITEHMLCAASKDKDSCSGDSGGPLFFRTDNGEFMQVGIVSWGIGCAQEKYPGVYSRVSQLLPWINRIRKEYF